MQNALNWLLDGDHFNPGSQGLLVRLWFNPHSIHEVSSFLSEKKKRMVWVVCGLSESSEYLQHTRKTQGVNKPTVVGGAQVRKQFVPPAGMELPQVNKQKGDLAISQTLSWSGELTHLTVGTGGD